VARLRVREGRHAGWAGELITELSDPQVAYLRIQLSSGRTALLVVERAKLEPATAPPASCACSAKTALDLDHRSYPRRAPRDTRP
jgi:hypothetical protein